MAAFELPSLPPEEAIAYFRAKGQHLDASWAWQDFWQEDHAVAFTVAKSAGFDILKDIHQSLLDAMEQGQTFDDWKRKLVPTLQDKGWWGRKALADPSDPNADPQSVQLGSPRRLRTIWDVNMRTSWAAGRWNQIERTAHAAPWLRYTAVLDSKTRPLHALWHGTILRFDDPWWKTHFPPNGWFCRCTVVQFSDHDLARHDLKVSQSAPDDGPSIPYTNPRTGEVSLVPPGIDPGFGYNPGQTAFKEHAARVAATKWVDAPPALTAAEQADSVRYMLPALTKDIGTWIDGVASGAIPETGDRRVVGALSQEVLDFLAKPEIDLIPDTGAITLGDADVIHFMRQLKQDLGKAPSMDDLKAIPEALADPQAILWDKDKQNLLYVYPASDDPRSVKLAVEIDAVKKAPAGVRPRKKLVTNTIIHASRLNPQILEDRTRYELVDGDL
jgi:SPP1 gp7 family putative phage head morphogenesis protein